MSMISKYFFRSRFLLMASVLASALLLGGTSAQALSLANENSFLKKGILLPVSAESDTYNEFDNKGTGAGGKFGTEPKPPPQNDQTNNADGSIMIRLGPANVETFLLPNAQSMSLSFVKLTGLDLTDPVMIDEFARVNYCHVYKQYYKNEFRWRYARKAIRQVINRQLEFYPEHFVIHGKTRLGRYNFERHAFILPPEARMEKTGLFHMEFGWPDGCAPAVESRIIPDRYSVRLDNPVNLSSIPASTKFAEFITREMDRRENFDRTTYVSFYIRVNDFSVTHGAMGLQGNVRANLLSLRFYADPGRKILIYDYRPRAGFF